MTPAKILGRRTSTTAKLKVFLSSTVDDLRDARNFFREQIQISNVELVCYEDHVSDNPGEDLQDLSLRLVRECGAIIMLLDRCYGTKYHRKPFLSITHAEFREAKKRGLRIIPIVPTQTLHEYWVWKKNQGSRIAALIKYRRVQEPKLFQFIHEIERKRVYIHQWNTLTSKKELRNIKDAIKGLLAPSTGLVLGHTALPMDGER